MEETQRYANSLTTLETLGMAEATRSGSSLFFLVAAILFAASSVALADSDIPFAVAYKMVNYYVQSHIQINEYRDRVILPAATKKYQRYIGTCIKVLDMTGLKLSALGHIKLLTLIATIDDLNYPEKTQTYYVVNAPYVFSACWKVVKPLLQERTTRKVQVLQGCGRDELLKVMDYNSLPHFCRKERYKTAASHDYCYSSDHSFHQELYNYMKQQALGLQECAQLLKHRSSRADTDRTKLVKAN